MKLRGKILMMCLGCTLFALILQTLLFQEMSSSLIYSRAKEESVNSLQNMQNEIYSFAKGIESHLIEIYSEKDLIDALKENESIASLRTEFYRKAYDIGTSKFVTGDNVVSLYLYTPDHNIISTYRRAVTPKHNYQTDIYNDIEADNAKAVLDYIQSEKSDMLISSYYNQYREKDIIRFVLKLYDNSNFNDKIGYVVCDVDSRAISSIMEKYSTDKTMFIWLQPTGDRPAVSIGKLDESEEENYKRMSREIAVGSDKERVVSPLSKQELFQVEQNKYNLTAYSLMPQELLKQNQKALTVNLLVIAVMMVLIAAFLTFMISKSLTRSLDMLMGTIQRIKGGDTQLRADINNKDEIGELGRNFNEMLDEMEILTEKEKQANLLVVQAEYKALQAQINPHFLYNTLDTMSSIAEVKNCQEVSILSQSLSNIFRYSLNMKEPLSTVSKELVHLRNYTYVMSMRMQDHVQYDFDIDEEVLACKIPRISIQPLVENALNHGLRHKRGEKKIRIEAKRKNDLLFISVADNGVGMDAAKMNQKLAVNNWEHVEMGNSIGLYNINARLKLLYGDEYGVHIESVINEGTTVYMTIPEERKEEERERENI